MRVHLNMTFFLSAHHWVSFNNIKGKQHTHIWEITIKIGSAVFNQATLEIGFSEVDKIVRDYLGVFEGQVLNQFKPFNDINPSTENLGLFFSRGLMTRLSKNNFFLEELTIKESPTKGFIVTDLDDNPEGEHFFSGEPERIKNSGGIDKLEQGVFVREEITVAAREVAATAVNQEESSEGAQPAAASTTKWQLAAAALLIFFVNLALYSPILFAKSPLPWGSDTWGHLYKTEFLFGALKTGNIFPRYFPDWYNGMDPFRYYAPLSYYILLVFRYLTGDIFRALSLFLFMTGFVGSSFWLVFRKRIGLSKALILAVMWTMIPDNIRVAFSEGNIPRVMALLFLPLLIYLVIEVLTERRNRSFYPMALIITVNLIVLSHAMMGALFLTGLTLYSFFVLFLGGTDIKKVGKIVYLFGTSLAISAWWLLPSLSGGITSINQDAMSESAAYFSPLISLNPVLRPQNPEILYFGLGYVILGLFACYKWRDCQAWQKASILLGFLIFLITTPFAKPLYEKLPLHNLLWPDLFVPLGVAVMILGSVGSLKVQGLFRDRKFVKLAFTVLLLVFILGDSLVSAALIRTRTYPAEIDSLLRMAAEKKAYKVAMLDMSGVGSSPTYLASQKYGLGQVFGWAWQGAYTGQNTMLINTALEKGWYSFLFDRLIEIGATDLIVKNDVVKVPQEFRNKAVLAGYKLKAALGGMTLYTRNNGPYMVTADYRILGIGRFTPNISMIFPEIELGPYNEVDKYSLSDLKKYKVLFLSGCSWKSKKAAEDLVLAYARNGGRVIIDLSGTPTDVLSNRSTFLGVVGEPVIMDTPPLISVGSTVTRLNRLPKENMPWKTFVLEGVDKISSLVTYYDKKHPIEGYKVYRNQNIYFVGLNLPYYAYLTKDPVVMQMIGDLLQTEVGQTLPRTTVDIKHLGNSRGGSISFNLPPELSGQKMIVPLAYLDSMDVNVLGPKSTVGKTHNLITIHGEGGVYQMKFTNHWPSSTKKGLLLTLAGLLLTAVFFGIRPAARKLQFAGSAVLVGLFLLAISPQAALAADEVVMDGAFDDWNSQAFIDDPQGDVMDVSDRTAIAGDTQRIYWATNQGEGEPNLYFSVIRYQPMDLNHKMTGKIMFDINNNGIYADPDDKIGAFRYDPNSRKVAVKVFRVDDQNNSSAWHEVGKWGAAKNGSDDGLQFEFYFPFTAMGIIPGQPIRFNVTTSFIANDNPKREEDWVRDPGFDDFDLFKHDFDVIPDPELGDIQYSPVPVLGYPLLAVLIVVALAGGIFAINKRKLSDDGKLH